MRTSHHRIYMSDAYCILVDHYSRVESVILPCSFLILSPSFSHGVSSSTGEPPNGCKATPLWRGQRVNESSGNLYMLGQSWLSPVNCKANVLLQCLLTLSNWTNHVHWTVQASLNIPTFQDDTLGHIRVVSMRWQNSRATRLGNIHCLAILAHLQVTTAPITVLQTSSALQPCKLHRFTNYSVQMTCSWTQLHQMTTEPIQPLRISRYWERYICPLASHDSPN